MEAAVGDRTFVVWRQQQEAPTFPAIRAGTPEIDDVTEPHVVDHAEGIGRGFEDHRPILQADGADVVDGVGVGREE